LKIQDIVVGTEKPRARPGKRVSILYTACLDNGTVVRQTNDSPFSFTLCKNEDIKGLDMGLQGMAVGGKRKLTVPPNLAYGEKGLAYGEKGSLQAIPKNATLHFEVTLMGAE
jgi:FKBP-type peptidyl-prolyl cis-trans isomerase